MAKLIDIATKIHSTSAFKSSKTNEVLNNQTLTRDMSINEFKEAFQYSLIRGQVTVMVWLHLGTSGDIYEYKHLLAKTLRHENIYINDHWAPIDSIETSLAGWYSQNYHPDAVNLHDLHEQINRGNGPVFRD